MSLSEGNVLFTKKNSFAKAQMVMKEKQGFWLCETNSTVEESSAIDTRLEEQDENESLLSEEDGQLSWWSASFIMLKFIVCSGFLFLPHAVSNAGWALSLILFIFAWTFNLFSMLRLKQARDLIQGQGSDRPSSQENIAKNTIGLEFKKLTSFLVITAQLMFICNAFHLITTVSRQTFFEEMRLGDQATAEIVLNSAVVFLLASLALVRKIETFEQFFQAGSAAVAWTAIYLICTSSQKLANDGVAAGVYSAVPQTSFIFLSEAMFAMEGLPCILPVQDMVKREDKKKFNLTIILSMSMVLVIQVVTSILCYLSIGDRLKPNILEVMDKDPQYSREFIKLTQLFSIAISVPIELLPAFQSLEKQYFKKQHRSNSRHWKKNAMRFTLSSSCCFLAQLFRTQQDKLIGLLGSIIVIPLACIIPWLLHQFAILKVKNSPNQKGSPMNTERNTDIFAMVVGSLCVVFAFATSCYFISNRS